MRRKFIIINFILIIFISVILSQSSLALRPLDFGGNLRWGSEYSKDKDGSSHLLTYTDYEVGLDSGGALVFPQIGSYNFGISYRDYINKSEGLKPRVNSYNFGINLLPRSPLSLNLTTEKQERDYGGDDKEEVINTVFKRSFATLHTPLPLGLRLSSEIKLKENFDVTKEKVDNQIRKYDIKLNKDLNFNDLMKTKITTKYKNLLIEDSISMDDTVTKTKSLFINNYLYEDFLYLSDIDGGYSISDQKNEQSINYSLKTTWNPLDYLKIGANYRKRINKERVQNKFIDTKKNTSLLMNFKADPYPILSFDGRILKSNSQIRDNGAADKLNLGFGADISYWDGLPLKFDISNTQEELVNHVTKQVEHQSRNEASLASNFDFYNIDSKLKISNNRNEKSDENNGVFTQKSTNLSLNNTFPNFYFGNFTLNSSYGHKLIWKNKKKEKESKSNSQINSKSLNIGLKYQRYLFNNFNFFGGTHYNSDLEDFGYTPNYNFNLNFSPYRRLKLKLGVKGYHQDKDDFNVVEEIQNYRRWNGEINFYTFNSQWTLNFHRNNDLIQNNWDTGISLKGSYRYRSMILRLKARWREDGGYTYNPGDTLRVTTSLTRYF
ncbi:hypothetical protein [Selenihalanaerobacter shriftii]|uniref:Uncharacterized protein n=1 Tax=Selenihalanaerobacter shriftii TaxID=142842 RepID=A0A1T4L4S5_9FIRM|nr:hypothetical protein [Selenihalanaerobacter shriftii]SJZ49633.1 hypothetical protein SAMN02745118_01036 [Selenihalanaerobacter shriftii]